MVAVRNKILGATANVPELNDVRIAGSSIGKYAFVLPADYNTRYIFKTGIQNAVRSLEGYGVTNIAVAGQPTITTALDDTLNANIYKLNVTDSGIVISGGSDEAVIGGLNRLAHIVGEATAQNKALRLDKGYAAEVQFEALDDEFAVTFNDEFDSELDRSIWTDPDILYDTTTEYLNESGTKVETKSFKVQSATASTTNGYALLSAKAYEKNGKTVFASSSISTNGTMQYMYGYIEVRAKLGSHPTTNSIWLKPFSSQQEYFPEIDILENHSQDDTNHMKFATNIHTWECGTSDFSNHRGSGNKWNTTDDNTMVDGDIDLSADYHTYGMRWTPEKFEFYFDGVKYYEITFQAYIDNYVTSDPWWAAKPNVTLDTFRQPMSLILSNGIAGVDYGPMFDIRDDAADTEGNYQIDYVRISQMASDGGSMEINPLSSTEINNNLEYHSQMLGNYGLN